MKANAWANSDVILDVSACPECGHEGCEGHDQSTPHPEAPQPARRWQRAAETIEAPAPDPIVEGFVWSDAISVLVAESSVGKTFLLHDLSGAISAGVPWHGRKVQHGSVIYLGFEGSASLRLRALREVAGQRLEHLYTIPATDPLSPGFDYRDRIEVPSRGELDATRDLDEIVATVQAAGDPPVALVEVDTVRASLAGSEDSSEAVSAYLRVIRRLMTHAPGAAFILSHHAGWQDGETKRKRERGSSAFRGNVDNTFYLEAHDYNHDTGEARLILTTIKVRDGEALPPLHLIRRRVEIPGLVDRWGQPITSCLIESDHRTREDREVEQAQVDEAKNRDVDLKVLQAMRDYRTATSVRTLRALVNLGEPVVTAAVGRILRSGWAVPGKRGEPYQVQAEGHQRLE